MNLLYEQKSKNPENYEKYFNDLLGSIEFVMFYCKNLRAREDMKIGHFIHQAKLEHNSGELNKK